MSLRGCPSSATLTILQLLSFVQVLSSTDLTTGGGPTRRQLNISSAPGAVSERARGRHGMAASIERLLWQSGGLGERLQPRKQGHRRGVFGPGPDRDVALLLGCEEGDVAHVDEV